MLSAMAMLHVMRYALNHGNALGFGEAICDDIVIYVFATR